MQHKKVTFTGEELRRMRMERQMSIREFWKALGYSLSRGHSYETGKTKIPEDVRRLVYLHYTLGVPTDPDSEECQRFAQGVKLNNARELVESAVGLMQNTLSELKQ